MASAQTFVDYIAEQMAAAGDVRSRKMFGEYAIYCNDKVIALVCDNKLYLKVTKTGLKLLPNATHEPAYQGAKPSILIPEELYDDHEFMTKLARETSNELPMPKPKKKHK